MILDFSEGEKNTQEGGVELCILKNCFSFEPINLYSEQCSYSYVKIKHISENVKFLRVLHKFILSCVLISLHISC